MSKIGEIIQRIIFKLVRSYVVAQIEASVEDIKKDMHLEVVDQASIAREINESLARVVGPVAKMVADDVNELAGELVKPIPDPNKMVDDVVAKIVARVGEM